MRRRLVSAAAIAAIAVAGLLAAPGSEARAEVHAHSASVACGLVGSVPLLGAPAAELCNVAGSALGEGVGALNAVTGLHLPTSLGGAVGSLAQAGANAVLNGVSGWIASGAVWLMSRVANLVQTTTHPQLTSGWFGSRYRTMVDLAFALAVPLVIFAAMRALWSRDLGELFRSVLLYLPLAAVLTAAAVVVTQMGIDVTDNLSGAVSRSVGGDAHQFLTGATKGMIVIGAGGAVAGKAALPGFVVAIGAVVAAVGAFVLWIELVLREAAIYVAVIFMPLSFVALIWPATARIARRTVEALAAIVLSKFVIVAIIALAASGLVHSGLGDSFSAALAGVALILLACFAPVALLKMLPLMEAAVAHHGHTRAALAGGPQRAMNAHEMVRGAIRAHHGGGSGGGLSGAAGGGIRPSGGAGAAGGGGSGARAAAAGTGVGLAVAGAAAAGNAVASRASGGGAAAAAASGAAAAGTGTGRMNTATGGRSNAAGAVAGDSAAMGATDAPSSAPMTADGPATGATQQASAPAPPGVEANAPASEPDRIAVAGGGTAPAAPTAQDASSAAPPPAQPQAAAASSGSSPLDPPLPAAGAPSPAPGPQAPAELQAADGADAITAGMAAPTAPGSGPPFDGPPPLRPAAGAAPGVVRPPARAGRKQPLPPEQLIPEEESPDD